MLGCYINCSKILVEVNRLMVEGRGSRSSNVEVKDIDDKSIDKRLKCGRKMTD
jgi:hypothetical protein